MIIRIAVIMVLLTACSHTPVLPEPQLIQKPNNQKTQTLKSKASLNNKGLVIISDDKQHRKQYKKLINKAYAYLYQTYGKPKYQGIVEVHISSDAIKHPKVSWKNRAKRKVILSTFYMFPSELPTIAHELFHALYQTDELVEAYPEFVLEGMAIYVENLYKYKKQSVVVEKLHNKMKNDKICEKIGEAFNFNDDFQKYDSRTIYYLYITGGYFFANQISPNKLIKQMIGSSKHKKNMTVTEIMKQYKLTYFPCEISKMAVEQKSLQRGVKKRENDKKFKKCKKKIL